MSENLSVVREYDLALITMEHALQEFYVQRGLDENVRAIFWKRNGDLGKSTLAAKVPFAVACNL